LFWDTQAGFVLLFIKPTVLLRTTRLFLDGTLGIY